MNDLKEIPKIRKAAQDLLDLVFNDSEYSLTVMINRKDGKHDFGKLAYATSNEIKLELNHDHSSCFSAEELEYLKGVHSAQP